MQRDEAIRSATFGAGHFYMPPKCMGSALPDDRLDPVAVASEFSLLPMRFQYWWLRLVEQLPITAAKKQTPADRSAQLCLNPDCPRFLDKEIAMFHKIMVAMMNHPKL